MSEDRYELQKAFAKRRMSLALRAVRGVLDGRLHERQCHVPSLADVAGWRTVTEEVETAMLDYMAWCDHDNDREE